ncbi:hypothetical protein [Pimelobacter simplex]|uniref:hypothetical protein n=1 Tax=Nocardioides simplex TaxID=2045 RepID=UPI00214F8F1C|nr:hypothetical protein [Pimelobacter simplex]UUW88388.1 hypothetical protein M0M43_21950 [Pimelobacter simplex]UUW97892.1 hypothetical protein M0M48_10595 [Pimelobacter simplex]
MTKGGARPRSGPAKDPTSRTSERARRAAKKTATVAGADAASSSPAAAITSAEFNPLALPASGRGGRAPAFPLPKIVRFGFEVVDNKTVKVADRAIGDAFRKRELELWRELWKTPQALAWEREPWRWPTVAKYCRIMASTEAEPDASAALLSRERELRNECGLSPDGLRMNGWAIAPDELAAKRSSRAAAKAPAKKAAPVRRLRG